jgi:hypothetical protein
MSDLIASGNDPGTQYQPSETDGIYHEDREVTVPGGPGSQMFRVNGAQFDSGGGFWNLQPGASVAYATVQNPDGSIHYFTQSNPSGWTTSEWVGSDNNAIYNGVDYGMTVGDMSGATNTPALNAAIVALLAAGGGTLFIPAGTYNINGAIAIQPGSGSPLPAGIIIAGVSGQTKIVQNSASDIFDVTDINNDLGVRFRDLYLSYASFDPGTSTYVAVNVQSSNAVTCERVYFNNCPRAFQTDLAGEFNGLFDCWINYDLRQSSEEDALPVDGQTMISLGGAEDFVASCVLHQKPVSDANPGPTGCTGIVVGLNTSSRFISNTHISDFAVGLQISGGSKIADTSINAVRINAYQNAVIIQPASEGDTIYTVHFSNCTFANTLYGNTLGNPATSGVLISTAGRRTSTSQAYISPIVQPTGGLTQASRSTVGRTSSSWAANILPMVRIRPKPT